MLVKSWSSATLTSEAEYNALVRGAAELLALKAVLDELGWELPIDIKIDSAAAKSTGGWLGLGWQRHIEVKPSWVQEAVRQRRLRISRFEEPQLSKRTAGTQTSQHENRNVDHRVDDLQPWNLKSLQKTGP